jgi:hypothetical protein
VAVKRPQAIAMHDFAATWAAHSDVTEEVVNHALV